MFQGSEERKRGLQKMMYSEFYERTKTEISYDEYHYVEESYYDFNGNKDEFCKSWLKDVKSGKWALELRLRKAIDAQKADYEKKIAELQETIEFYRPYYDVARNEMRRADEATECARVANQQLKKVYEAFDILKKTLYA